MSDALIGRRSTCEICSDPAGNVSFIAAAHIALNKKYKIDSSIPAWKGLVCGTALELKYPSEKEVTAMASSFEQKSDESASSAMDDIVFGAEETAAEIRIVSKRSSSENDIEPDSPRQLDFF